jgi:hypothetical protein
LPDVLQHGHGFAVFVPFEQELGRSREQSGARRLVRLASGFAHQPIGSSRVAPVRS